MDIILPFIKYVLFIARLIKLNTFILYCLALFIYLNLILKEYGIRFSKKKPEYIWFNSHSIVMQFGGYFSLKGQQYFFYWISD